MSENSIHFVFFLAQVVPPIKDLYMQGLEMNKVFEKAWRLVVIFLVLRPIETKSVQKQKIAHEYSRRKRPWKKA